MGIQDRDYYREGPSFLDRVGAQGATAWLVAITCGVFFGEFLTGMLRSPLVQIGVYDPRLILEGEIWRLLTAVFLHADLWHLFFNMLALYWAGQRLEDLYGAREFVLFYILVGVAANIAYLLAYLVGLCPATSALGASGAVVGVLVLFAIHFPRQRLLLFLVIPIPAWGLVLLYVTLDLSGALGLKLGNGERNIGYIVHLAGAFFALMYYLSGWRLSKVFDRTQARRSRPQLRILSVPPPERETEPVGAPVEAVQHSSAAPADEQLEAQLDAVLEKVSKYGQNSLTVEEREILFRASEVFKKRRR
jgi:membrane associated rhomboid family serine protease